MRSSLRLPPRLFRLAQDEGIVNRMGFNNGGIDAALARIAALKARPGVLGINVGANKDSDDRVADYALGVAKAAPHADYITINVSSPNTPGLRDLQSGPALEELLGRLAETRAALTCEGPRRPLLLKVAPDLADSQIEVICDQVAAFGLDGVIVGNTTLSRPDGLRSPLRDQAGGLSMIVGMLPMGLAMVVITWNWIGSEERRAALAETPAGADR